MGRAPKASARMRRTSGRPLSQSTNWTPGSPSWKRRFNSSRMGRGKRAILPLLVMAGETFQPRLDANERESFGDTDSRDSHGLNLCQSAAHVLVAVYFCSLSRG